MLLYYRLFKGILEGALFNIDLDETVIDKAQDKSKEIRIEAKFSSLDPFYDLSFFFVACLPAGRYAGTGYPPLYRPNR